MNWPISAKGRSEISDLRIQVVSDITRYRVPIVGRQAGREPDDRQGAMGVRSGLEARTDNGLYGSYATGPVCRSPCRRGRAGGGGRGRVGLASHMASWIE